MFTTGNKSEASQPLRHWVSLFSVLVAAHTPAPGGAQANRFTWVDVPYDFASPGVVLPGATNCSGSSTSSAEVNSFYNNIFGTTTLGHGRASATENCTTGPTIYAPPSSSRRVLRVHIDCQNKTYDAKGDGMGWKAWDAEYAVYSRAIIACAQKGFTSEGGIEIVSEEENRRVIASGKFTFEWCVSASLKNIAATEKALSLTPGAMGLSPAQVPIYINRIRASVPGGCEKSQQIIAKGGTYDLVQAAVWSGLQADALESAHRAGR